MNFYRGWPGLVHEDWRYSNFRQQYPSAYWIISFFGIHLFPTIMVFLGCLPFMGAFSGLEPAYPIISIAGLVVMFGAIFLAYISDEQLRRYKHSKAGSLKEFGIWKYSRHPNYLGEIMTWWGILLFGISFGTEYLWTGIGALLITLMFVFISIPLMEKHLLKKNPGYGTYRDTVPSLIPWTIFKKRSGSN